MIAMPAWHSGSIIVGNEQTPNNATYMNEHTFTTRPHANRAAKLALAGILTLALATAPLAAFAEAADVSDDTAATSSSAATSEAATSSASASAESESSSSSLSPEARYGLYASSDTVFSNDESYTTTARNAFGAYVADNVTLVANGLFVRTRGNVSAAIAVTGDDSKASVANAELKTTGADSPLFWVVGAMEADGVTGEATSSAIASVVDSGRVLIANSSLTSSYTGAGQSSLLPETITAQGTEGYIDIYRTDTTDASTDQVEASLFQAVDSKLECDLESGAFFNLTNTVTSISLSNCNLDFDTDNVELLTAAGNDKDWGTVGKNGATATFTARNQQLAGAIDVDSISSLNLFLLEGTTWTGSSTITPNGAGTDMASNIVVNIDSTSGWVVTENSTVTTLNIEKGGTLVDEAGKSVTIVDADGNKLVDGASDIKVSVTGEFTTTVKTTDANTLRESSIDRAEFDTAYGTSTTFGTNSVSQSDEERAAELQSIIASWFDNL